MLMKCSGSIKNHMMVQSDRGVIVDRHGHPLALNVDVPSVFVNPKSLKDSEESGASVFGPYCLDVRCGNSCGSYSRIQANRASESLENISDERAKQGRGDGHNRCGSALKVRSVFIPKKELGSHILGFAGDDNQGLEGVEFHYESFLRGEKSLVRYQRDALRGDDLIVE